MPELPEVEVIRRDLEKEVVGKKVKAVDVTGMRSIRRYRQRKQFTSALVGKKLMGVERRGKYLLVKLDGGMGAAWDVVLRLFTERITEAATGPGGDDYKTRLQELAAQRFDRLPRYQVRDEGPDHAKRFFATVLLDGQAYGNGEGGSKKQAEQAAARAAWERVSAGESPIGSGEDAGA